MSKRRSNRFKSEGKIIEDQDKINGKGKTVEKDILSDEDVPLSVTKANLVAENSKDAITLQPVVIQETDKQIESDLTTKSIPNDKDKFSNDNLCKDQEKKVVEMIEESKPSGQIEKVVVNKKRSKIKIPKELPPPKEPPAKRGRKKKLLLPAAAPPSPPPEQIKDLPSIIENDTEKLVDSGGNENKPNDENHVIIQESITNVEEQNTPKTIECEKKDDEKFDQNEVEESSIKENNISNENIKASDDKKSTVENSENADTSSQVKKKRKRRKNELAAIVADQLLESFKEVDKSRIDDLKMLENLAYEKSEDLLLTGK